MALEEIYLVRHGNYDFTSKRLNAEGIKDSERAAEELMALGLGSTAVILSSDAPRAIGTAEIISQAFGEAKIVTSHRVNLDGNRPDVVENLDSWLEKSLEEEGVSISEQALVVVAHEPLIRVAVHGTCEGSQRIANGQIVQYEPGSWQNQDYRWWRAENAEEELSSIH